LIDSLLIISQLEAEDQRRRTKLDIEFLDLPGEQIPLPDGSVDTVVSTFTLCTIPGLADTIRGISRVLRPRGRFLFFEHGLSPDIRVRRWQERTEPFFQWAFEGCDVTRDIPAPIERPAAVRRGRFPVVAAGNRSARFDLDYEY